MNWKNEAVEMLRSYEIMRHAAGNLPRQIRILEEEAATIKAGSATLSRSRGRGRREDVLLDHLMKRQELEKQLSQTQGWLETMDDALDALGQEERQILQTLFVRPESGAVADLCQTLGVEYATLYRRRDKALQRFTRALYGALES